jgi:hypothetical protein
MIAIISQIGLRRTNVQQRIVADVLNVFLDALVRSSQFLTFAIFIVSLILPQRKQSRGVRLGNGVPSGFTLIIMT